MNEFENNFNPFDELMRLHQSHQHLNQAMIEFSQLCKLNTARVDNLLDIIQNQQKQIDILAQRQGVNTPTTLEEMLKSYREQK